MPRTTLFDVATASERAVRFWIGTIPNMAMSIETIELILGFQFGEICLSFAAGWGQFCSW